VKDNGKGIDPEVLKQGSRRGHWGLPGMRERAEAIGAELDVWSSDGSGTEVSLRVPAGIAYGTPSRRLRWFSREAMNAIRILAVDDHPLFREGIAAILEGQPDMSLVGEASDGREAIQQFRAHRPHVILMDLQMPEMNGLDATIAICGEDPGARIIVLTTYMGDVQVMRALRAGARAYLLKNLLHKELLDTIRAVYGGKKTISRDFL
jgi:CheY-like chemotaxis protein